MKKSKGLAENTPEYFKIPEEERAFAMSISVAITKARKNGFFDKNKKSLTIPLASVKEMPSEKVTKFFALRIKESGWRKINFEQGKQHVFLNVTK